jgi:hypothetical protein
VREREEGKGSFREGPGLGGEGVAGLKKWTGLATWMVVNLKYFSTGIVLAGPIWSVRNYVRGSVP